MAKDLDLPHDNYDYVVNNSVGYPEVTA